MNMWVLKDNSNIQNHDRPLVTNNLNDILENSMWTNKCLIEIKKSKLTKKE